ncbi:hypothetical protein P0F65_14120 [Sphingomonas sp. I4]
MIVVSDGAASHPDSAAWPRPRLIAARERKADMRCAACVSVVAT